MKYKKLINKTIILGIILANLPINSLANNSYYNSNKTTSHVEKADTWISNFANMPTKRRYLTSSVVDNKIYCIGGMVGSIVNTLEVYDPATDTWETKTPMPTARRHLTSSVVDGKIYVFGGQLGNNSQSATVEVYDPATDTWETKAPMPTARCGLTSSVVDGKIYVFGGYGNTTLNTLEVYNPATNTWETKTSMPTRRVYFNSSVVDNKIYIIGGWNNPNYISKLEVYDPETDTWEEKAEMPSARELPGSAVVDGKIYVIGGNKSGSLNTVEMYNPDTDTWETKTPMPTARAGFCSEVINNKIYCMGGNATSYTDVVEAYVAKEYTDVDKALSLVESAEVTKDIIDINKARMLVNSLPEGEDKEQLQARLNSIMPKISLEPKNSTANLDVYIKSENMLKLSLDTNSITFEDFSGISDIEKPNAVNLTVSSSLLYKVDAYLATEIQNTQKNKNMDKEVLKIKANEKSEDEYASFIDVNITPITLLDNQVASNDKVHGVDLKLVGGEAYEKDNYKATIKFEVGQK